MDHPSVLLASTETSPGCSLRQSSLPQQTPGSLVLITLQPGVDDGAGSPPDHHLLSGLHLITQVGQAALRVHLELFLVGPTRTRTRNRTERVNNGLELEPSPPPGRYLFLSCDPLLVSLPPGRVVDVEERFVSCGDSTGSEQLKKNQ